MSEQLFTLPQVVVFDTNAALVSGAKANFYIAGTLTRQNTFTDSALTVASSNPVIADGNGILAPIYLDATLNYKVDITDSLDASLEGYPIDNLTAALTATEVGTALWPVTTAETSAGITPTNIQYEPGNVLRYGTNTTPGTTDMTTAINNAVTAAKGGDGIAYLPNGTYATSAEILLDANIIFRGDGFLSIIQPLAETFAVIRVEPSVASGSANWGIEDLTITYVVQATASTAIGIKLDDSAGATYFPDGGHVHRVHINNPYTGFFDDTIAFNMDIKQLIIFEPRFKGILLNKSSGTMYSFDKCWVKADSNTAIAIDISGLHYLMMTGCAVDNYDGSQAAVSILTCTGVIDSLDIEQCETSIDNSGLLNLFNFTGVVEGCRLDTNTLTGSNGSVISIGGSGRGRVILNAVVVSTTTAGASNNAHGLIVASGTTSLQINGDGIDAPTGGSGSHTEIKDASEIANRFDENGLVLRSITSPTELVTTTNVITAVENGKTFYLNAVGGFTSTLPEPALGLKYTFIVKTAPTTAYIITTNGGDNILQGSFLDIVGELSAITNQDTLNFVADKALPGDRLEVESDGTSWFCLAFSKVDGGITISAT